MTHAGMINFEQLNLPRVLQGITSTTEDLELTMGDELRFGSLLRTLAGSRLGDRVLQIGAGSGILTAWLLDGMGTGSSLTSLEADVELARVAGRFLGRDERLEIRQGSMESLLAELEPGFGLIVTSTPLDLEGRLREAVRLLAPGGLFVVGGLVEQPDWTAAERGAAQTLVSRLEVLEDLQLTPLEWSSGVLLASHRSGPAA